MLLKIHYLVSLLTVFYWFRPKVSIFLPTLWCIHTHTVCVWVIVSGIPCGLFLYNLVTLYVVALLSIHAFWALILIGFWEIWDLLFFSACRFGFWVSWVKYWWSSLYCHLVVEIYFAVCIVEKEGRGNGRRRRSSKSRWAGATSTQRSASQCVLLHY